MPPNSPTLASGVWTADDSFTMTIRLTETPFYVTLIAKFQNGQVTFETFPNVGFEVKRIFVEAHAL
jgi:hypothetical protein